ncbi:MAG TPA: M14 family zinc carboxypeptidase [Marmoricola sp.]|nr:M14 family zinc carboxypeptidase [Marmoricola sp.]
MVRRSRARTSTLVASGAALALAVPLAATIAAPATGAPPPERRAACDPFREPVVDLEVPTAQEVIGIDLGERDVTTEESDRYLRAVADASPMVVDGVLARSWNGRALRYAVVGQEKWVKPRALARIGRQVNALRDVDTPDRRAKRIARHTPAILWVAGNVHGGEESGTDASLRVLYELAARTDCTAETILDRAIVVVLPTQNPDGREADTRRNAYGFDLNRDWFARTQVETDGKIAKLRELPPQLFIDAHEMGSDGYFFPPNADPVYHDIGETPLNWIYNVYGTAMQKAFKRFDFPFFNGSFYDLFYMGYGDTVPAAGFNAAGMTFEKNNEDPAEQRVREQYTAIWATLMAAGERHSMLSEWRAEHVKAARQGRRGVLERNQLYWEGADIEVQPNRKVRHYFIRADQPAKAPETARLVERLQGMDVEVYRLTKKLRVPGYRPYGYGPRTTTLPKGTYWVPMAQGQKHWVQAMLNEDTYVPFPYFYDVTAFSGPLLNNVPGGYTGRALKVRGKLLPEQRPRAVVRVAGAPRVAIWQISEESSSSIEGSGWLRYFLDRRLRLEYADLTTEELTTGGLTGIDTLVIPQGSESEAAAALGEAGQTAIVDWVEAGGTLVTLRQASRLAADLGLTSATYEDPTSDIPGSLIRMEIDRGNPLSKGVGRTAYAMYEYDDVWTTTKPGTVAARYPAAGDRDWFVSGFAEGEEQLHGTAAVIDEAYGEGRVVLFGFDPNYRAFTDGTAKLLTNALFGDEPQRRSTRVFPRAQVQKDVPVSAHGRMVLSVKTGAANQVRALLAERDASAVAVRTPGRVSFRVDLGGMAGDQHPWARSLADDVAKLGDQVVAITLP